MSSEPSVPLVDLPASAVALLAEFSAPPAASQARLYRALANQPELLNGWIEIAWRLRMRCATPRRLRELLIIRASQIADCEIEIFGHQGMARDAGATEEELAAVAGWRSSSLFTPAERAAFEFTEAMMSGAVSDKINDELAKHYDAPSRVELVLTAGMYAMVPRVLDALRLSKRPK